MQLDDQMMLLEWPIDGNRMTNRYPHFIPIMIHLLIN